MQEPDATAFSMGIIGALKTGNPFLDVIISTCICLMVPLIFTKFGSFCIWIQQKVACLLSRRQGYTARRTMESKSITQVGGARRYVEEGCISELISIIVQYTSNQSPGWISHIPEIHVKSYYSHSGPLYYPINNSIIRISSSLELVLNNTVDERTGKSDQDDVSYVITTTINIYGYAKTTNEANAEIDKYIQNAIDYSIAKATQNKQRHILMSVSPSTNKDSICYQKHVLSDHKTFRSLFIPNKDSLIKMLDDFTLRRDKYDIEGHPSKITLLLYGPPGTGKTSLIKAIAQHTNRHVITANLKNIGTNTELREFMYNTGKKTKDGMPFECPFEKYIIVLEEIDAASHVVNARGGGVQEYAVPNQVTTSKSTEAVLCSVISNLTTSRDVTNLTAQANMEKCDELNLSELLTVLDGIVDTPGRIVIMTTNHIEKLDPALIREGRVTRKIFLDYLCVSEALEMFQHYLPKESITNEQKQLITDIFAQNKKITPARFEEIVCTFDTIDDVLKQLNKCS